MKVDREASLLWMQQVRQSLYGSLSIEDSVDPEVAAANRNMFRKALGSAADRMPPRLNDQVFDKQLANVSALLLGVLSEDERARVADLPVGGFPGLSDDGTGTRRSRDGRLAFIAIDIGLTYLLSTLNCLTVVAIHDSFQGDTRLPMLAAKARAAAIYFFTRGIYPGPIIYDLDLDDSLIIMNLALDRSQIAFILAHEYAHHLLGHFDDPNESGRVLPPLPGADLWGINVADVLNRQITQRQEIEADRKALEICLALFETDYPIKTPIDPAGIDALFQNLTLSMWLNIHYGIIPPGEAIDKYFNPLIVGAHPLPHERRQIFYDKLYACCDEFARGWMGSTIEAHSKMIKELERVWSTVGIDRPGVDEAEIARFTRSLLDYCDLEGIQLPKKDLEELRAGNQARDTGQSTAPDAIRAIRRAGTSPVGGAESRSSDGFRDRDAGTRCSVLGARGS